MKIPFITTIKTSVISISLLFGAAFTVNAEKADLNKVIEVFGDRTAVDLKSKMMGYMDNVVITQGTLKINADLVQVHTDEKTQEETYIARGNPATFRQTLEDGTPIYLQANEIKYEPAKNTVTISGNAELRQEGSKVTSDTITYNFATEQVLANSNNKDQVRTVLQPKVLDKNKK